MTRATRSAEYTGDLVKVLHLAFELGVKDWKLGFTTDLGTKPGESTSSTWHKTFTPESGIAVLSHEPKRSAHNLKVLGTVGNKGKDTWDLIRVEVDLFDAKGAFVGRCESYASGPILPGHQRYFDVDCGGSEREPTPEYTRYTVEVINASYEMEGGT